MTNNNQLEIDVPWKGVVAAGPLLRPDEAAKYVGFSTPHYYRMVARGLLPKPIKVGERATGVPRPWLDAVIASWIAGSNGGEA